MAQHACVMHHDLWNKLRPAAGEHRMTRALDNQRAAHAAHAVRWLSNAHAVRCGRAAPHTYDASTCCLCTQADGANLAGGGGGGGMPAFGDTWRVGAYALCRIFQNLGSGESENHQRRGGQDSGGGGGWEGLALLQAMARGAPIPMNTMLVAPPASGVSCSSRRASTSCSTICAAERFRIRPILHAQPEGRLVHQLSVCNSYT